VIIQKDSKDPGKPLIAQIRSQVFENFEAHNPDCGGSIHRASVTPRSVAILIKLCQDEGWDSSSQTLFEVPSGIKMGDYITISGNEIK